MYCHLNCGLLWSLILKEYPFQITLVPKGNRIIVAEGRWPYGIGSEPAATCTSSRTSRWYMNVTCTTAITPERKQIKGIFAPDCFNCSLQEHHFMREKRVVHEPHDWFERDQHHVHKQASHAQLQWPHALLYQIGQVGNKSTRLVRLQHALSRCTKKDEQKAKNQNYIE